MTMMSDTTPLWEFSDISKAYPGVLANDKVCIKLMKGSIHGLLGENGCGKSTMIKTLSGVQQPDSGKILHDGKEVQIPSSVSRILDRAYPIGGREYFSGQHASQSVRRHRLAKNKLRVGAGSQGNGR
jgi:ABC-type cobalamin/Fe3+-siderophores transport system ATPase subunit